MNPATLAIYAGAALAEIADCFAFWAVQSAWSVPPSSLVRQADRADGLSTKNTLVDRAFAAQPRP
jgi:drug/metabolite transporter superfamily protein YnfA